MKKVYTFLMLLSLASTTFVGCSKTANKGILGGPSVGGTVVKTVATVVGLILLSKLIKSVLKTVTGGSNSAFASLSGDKSFMSNFNENTKLNSFAQNDILKTALQALVSQHYQIPFSTVTNSYSKLTTVGELATFIGQNASAKSLMEIK